ncbi:hypothetical protein C5167_008876 [Papaver somniferum]|uniref:Uncharacterized protein n=1 Tax=Papaver somniferum TaxID=3469 RepID=A0A4Y7JX73_PAPSO|nr:hypothetical protein C5167_008876 [Papaver somniferum]
MIGVFRLWLGGKQDWQDRFKNMRRGNQEAHDKNDTLSRVSQGLTITQIYPIMKKTGKGPPYAEEEDLKKNALKSVVK